MSFTFFGTRSRAATAEDEVIPSQAQIDREITKLEEDSARDVQRQLEQQRSAAREGNVEERVKKVAEDVEEDLERVGKAAEQEAETIIKHAEADIKDIRVSGRRAEKGEADESR